MGILDEICPFQGIFLTLSKNAYTKFYAGPRKDKFDNSKYFGKEIFSQYVYENYHKIDFSQFIPLLDTIDSIIAQAEFTK